MAFHRSILFGILFYTYNLFAVAYQTRVINTAILPVYPHLRFHHIILVKPDSSAKQREKNGKVLDIEKLNDLYIIDYTPKKQPDFLGYIKLLLGYETEGIVRIIHLKKTNENRLVDDWFNSVQQTCDYDANIKKLNDRKIKKLINNWNTSFNLYSNNCQHFSEFIVKEL
jgi:hypothetical protein